MSSAGPLDLPTFLAALEARERRAYDVLLAEAESGAASRVDLRARFFALAAPVVARLGHGHPGPLWGEFQRGHLLARTEGGARPLDELAAALPYPLGLKALEVLRAQRALAEGRSQPQYPYEVVALMGAIVRLAALVAVRSYVDAGLKDARLNHLIVARLQAPSDGSWLELARRVSAALPPGSPGAALVAEALASRPALPEEVRARTRGVATTLQALQALVSFRNDLLKGVELEPAAIERAAALAELALRGFARLADYRLEVVHGGTTWALEGALPRPVEDGGVGLPESEPCLVHRAGAQEPLVLSPLLRFRACEEEGEEQVGVDELFLLNAGTLERLGYIGYRDSTHLDGRALGSYEAFKEFLSRIPTPPIAADPRLDDSGLAERHSRLFVGRETVLAELAERIREGSSQYLVLQALPGRGKTAILAALRQALRNRGLPEGERHVTPADAVVREGDHWVFHFCMRGDGRETPTVALRSIIAQVCDALGLERANWLSSDLDELKDQMLPALLTRASGLLEEGQRLVVAIDALDEGLGLEEDSVPSCLPAGEYPGVGFVLTWRGGESGAEERVEHALRHLAPERRPVLSSAAPLAGLERGDVDLYLERLAERSGGPRVTDAVRDAAWAAASREAPPEAPGADPFFLHFLAQSVQEGDVRLDREETLPRGLEEAFEALWGGLPRTRSFLCQRLLLTLAIMHDAADDELFAELFNRRLSGEERLTADDVAAARAPAGKLLVFDGERYSLFHDRFRRFLVGPVRDPIAEAIAARADT